ncbi:MAG TPA: hypothetical protein VGF21_12425 [Thermoleophilaceae bacterium]|jgi:hypothetical protein
MSVLVALTVGLVFWVAGWAFGLKAFDAFLVTIALTLGAATVRMVMPFVNQLLGREGAPQSQLGTSER